MKILLARILWVLHVGIACFVVFGCLSPWRGLLWGHFVFVPTMLLHWRLNNNRCFLTNLDYELRGISAKEVENPDGFVRSLLQIFLKELPSAKVIQLGNRAIAITSWCVTVIRLFLVH